MKLTIEQLREIGNKYFPDEDWDTAPGNQVRICIAERCFEGSETLTDESELNQVLIYTGISRNPPEDWALEEARKIFGTEIDNADLDLMPLGYDADTACKIYAALVWLRYTESCDTK